jgi:hypothetical protein
VLGQPSAQGHMPHGVAARLVLLATRPSGYVSAAQSWPKWPDHPVQRVTCTARGHHVVATHVAARPTPVGSGPNAVRSSVGAPAVRGGSDGQGDRVGDSPMCVSAGEVAGKGRPDNFHHRQGPCSGL